MEVCRCRAMLCISVACSVARCPSVTFVYFVETTKHTFKKFSPSVSHVILVFPVSNVKAILMGTSLTGASNAGGVGKNRDSRPVSGFDVDY